MVKRISVALVLLSLCALPAFAQTSLLPTLERIRPEYPTPMADWQLGEYLNRVAWEHRADGWGLLKKTGGSRCPSPQGVDVSCDILVHAPTTNVFDVLIDGTGQGIPTWRLIGPCTAEFDCTIESRWVAPISPGLQSPRNLRVIR